MVHNFYARVARSRSGSSSFTALALNKPSSSSSSSASSSYTGMLQASEVLLLFPHRPLTTWHMRDMPTALSPPSEDMQSIRNFSNPVSTSVTPPSEFFVLLELIFLPPRPSSSYSSLRLLSTNLLPRLFILIIIAARIRPASSKQARGR